ncbi:hypothetical protein EMPS_02510 [Entomortierella parvispora]|uniref:Uncharacterized protein n=1 Tax=Entomortierella parvispora TaxID=205924 RepID=A0A9P3H4V0_9FUNG|nr:hypothetical protein EMPS_02510 [Entomortierella parvispora]
MISSARITSTSLARALPRSWTALQTRMTHAAGNRIPGPRINSMAKPSVRLYSAKASPNASTAAEPLSEKSRMTPVLAALLVLGGVSLTAMGVWQFYTSGVNAFPEGIRNDLRKAIYYQNYGDDREKAVEFYRSALNTAMQHPDLKVDGPEVTGIMIQLGTMFQDMGRNQEAIDVLVMAFECLVHGRTLGTGNDDSTKEAATSSESDGAAFEDTKTGSPGETRAAASTHGPRVIMDGPTRLKTVGIAQKLGDLYHLMRKDQQAERYYLWSVEQLLKNHEQLEHQYASGASHDLEDAERLQMARDREAMKKQFNFESLPSWMTKTDLGASLEALGGFYASKGIYSNALPLYMRALSLVDNKSCHAAVIMSNISDALQGLGNVDDAVGWAERGLKISTNQSGQECDEGCGVILYNLGMLHEMKGDPLKAQAYYKQSRQHGLETGLKQCIVESNKALKRLRDSNEGTQA